MIRLLLTSFALIGVVVPPAAAQTSTAQPAPAARVFTLQEALQYAVEHYPTITEALEQVNASEAGVSVAKSAYLPHLDGVLQVNRATVNNVTGLLDGA